jgi:hypothetical protein
MAFRGGGRASVAGEGVDEVLQLEEGTGDVWCGPKGVNEGGMVELIEGERNSGAIVAVRSAGADTRSRREEE